jgi:hypothetical protein
MYPTTHEAMHPAYTRARVTKVTKSPYLEVIHMANTPPLTMRIDPDTVEVIRKIAEDEERSVSWVVNKLLNAAVEDYAGGLPPKK